MIGASILASGTTARANESGWNAALRTDLCLSFPRVLSGCPKWLISYQAGAYAQAMGSIGLGGDGGGGCAISQVQTEPVDTEQYEKHQ